MIPRYLALRERIHTELESLDQTQQAVAHHWSRALTVIADQDAYINSVALNLHSFYSGLEHLFELIAIELDGGTLGGADWHIELLRQMTLDLPPVRPPVLSKESAAKLDEYRKFCIGQQHNGICRCGSQPHGPDRTCGCEPHLRFTISLTNTEYRKFRHRVRNIYATNLDPQRMRTFGQWDCQWWLTKISKLA